jgi:hypothetical protein
MVTSQPAPLATFSARSLSNCRLTLVQLLMQDLAAPGLGWRFSDLAPLFPPFAYPITCRQVNMVDGEVLLAKGLAKS